MPQPLEKKHERELRMLEEVDNLSAEVHTLALNLAIYLAKVKAQTRSEELNRLEPEFIRLVNGTVKVVQEMTIILNAARNMERMVYEPPTGSVTTDRIESRLQDVLNQCGEILSTLGQERDFQA